MASRFPLNTTSIGGCRMRRGSFSQWMYSWFPATFFRPEGKHLTAIARLTHDACLWLELQYSKLRCTYQLHHFLCTVMVKKRCAGATCYQQDAFAVGGIAALIKVGYSARQIEESGAVTKGDGSVVSHQAVATAARKLREKKNWRGERPSPTLCSRTQPTY